MNVAVITRDNCIWCDKVKKLLGEYPEITTFEYNLVGSDPILLDFVKASGFTTVPIVFHAGNLIGGYVETERYIRGMLDDRF